MAYRTAAELFGDNGAFGTQVPIDFGPPAGVYDPTNRGIGFGEQLTSAIANRSHWALGENTDDLNTRLVVFETTGLDAAYRGGTLATPGSGRLITKDGGAVETTSTLTVQYTDDPANAHFRADALGDTTSGGGFDFRGSAVAVPAYGVLSRLNLSPSNNYTTMAASEPVVLNPLGLGADIVRFPSNVNNGSNTDVALSGLDFVEIAGGAINGLYRIFSIGPATTDLVVRELDGAIPVFPPNTAATSVFFVANMATSALAGLNVGAAVSATSSEDTALAIFGRDMDGVFGTGPEAALGFYPQREDGGSPGPLTFFTSSGRLKSFLTADGLATAARIIEWEEGGLPIVNVDKSEGGLSGFHEVGILVADKEGSTSSYAGLETRGRIIESTTLGVGASINGTYTALGVIELTDSDGTPPAPAGQAHGLWAALVQPGATLVKILTGTGAGRHYLLSSVTIDPVPTNRDSITITHLDGSVLDPGELPTSGSFTFRFYARTTVGGHTAPIAVSNSPFGWVAPADVTPNTILCPSTDVFGSADPDGPVAAVVAGTLIGANSPTTAGTHTLDVPWVLDQNGFFFTRSGVLASLSATQFATLQGGALYVLDGADQATVAAAAVTVTDGVATATVAKTGLTAAAASDTVSVTASAVTATSAPFTATLTASGVSATSFTDTASVTATSVSVTDGTLTSTVSAGLVTSPDFAYPGPPARTAYISGAKFNGSTVTSRFTDPEIEWFYADGLLTAKKDDAAIWLDLSGILRSGCIITSIEFRVNPGQVRGAGDRVRFRLRETDLLGLATIVASTDDGGSSALAWYSLTPGSPVILDFENYAYLVEIIAGDDGGVHVDDVVYGMRINYTDPGPRNH